MFCRIELLLRCKPRYASLIFHLGFFIIQNITVLPYSIERKRSKVLYVAILYLKFYIYLVFLVFFGQVLVRGLVFILSLTNEAALVYKFIHLLFAFYYLLWF